jgi:hypothetical protein
VLDVAEKGEPLAQSAGSESTRSMARMLTDGGALSPPFAPNPPLVLCQCTSKSGLLHSRCSLRDKGDVSVLKLHGVSDIFSRGGHDVKPCCRTRMDSHTPSGSYGISRTSLYTESETDPN